MARNMQKIIDEGRAFLRKRYNLGMDVAEAKALGDRIIADATVDMLWTTLSDAYKLGLMTGYNAGRRDQRKLAARRTEKT